MTSRTMYLVLKEISMSHCNIFSLYLIHQSEIPYINYQNVLNKFFWMASLYCSNFNIMIQSQFRYCNRSQKRTPSIWIYSQIQYFYYIKELLVKRFYIPVLVQDPTLCLLNIYMTSFLSPKNITKQLHTFQWRINQISAVLSE